jgi:DnaJ-class molecular chaperone
LVDRGSLSRVPVSEGPVMHDNAKQRETVLGRELSIKNRGRRGDQMSDGVLWTAEDCHECHGNGFILIFKIGVPDSMVCPRCNGTGTEPHTAAGGERR